MGLTIGIIVGVAVGVGLGLWLGYCVIVAFMKGLFHIDG